MRDLEIADRLVVLGVCVAHPMAWHLLDSEGDVIAVFTSEELLVRDWRVAGAAMERCKRVECRFSARDSRLWNTHVYGGPNLQGDGWNSESLPRGIIEAYVTLKE